MQARDVMSHPVTTIRHDATLADAAALMLSKSVGCLPVVGPDERIVGVLTETDFMAREVAVPWALFHAPKLFGEWLGDQGLEKIYAKARSVRVESVMSKPPIVASPGDTVDEVVRKMIHHEVARIPIVDDGRVVGIVTRHNLLRMIAGAGT